MFCPKCAQPSPDDQKFCRHCGFSLHEVAPLLSETSLTNEQGSHPETKAQRQERRLKRAAGLLVVSFVLWIVLLAMQDIPGLSQALKQILRYVSVSFFALALPLGLYLAVKAFSLWQFGGSTDHNLPIARDLPAVKQTAQLPAARDADMPSFESRPEPVPSVTERTTDLLRERRQENE